VLGTQVARMAPAVKADVAAHPLLIGAFGAQAVVAVANAIAQALEEGGLERGTS
jgi:hypothetical protein